MSTDLEVLKLVFHHHVLSALVRADSHVDAREAAVVKEIEPKLKAAGLMDETGELTPRYAEVKPEALRTLKDRLDTPRKKLLLMTFAAIAGIDERMDDAERSILSAAATVLDLDLEDSWALFQSGGNLRD